MNCKMNYEEYKYIKSVTPPGSPRPLTLFKIGNKYIATYDQFPSSNDDLEFDSVDDFNEYVTILWREYWS